MTTKERIERLRISRSALVVLLSNMSIGKLELLVMDGHDMSRYTGDTEDEALTKAEHMSGLMPPEGKDADCEAQ